jgi:hypothetical protein
MPIKNGLDMSNPYVYTSYLTEIFPPTLRLRTARPFGTPPAGGLNNPETSSGFSG